jgi:hypothetical protein
MTDIAKNLEKILNERPIKLSDIQDSQLSENDKALNELQKLCDKKLAYRFGVDEYVGRQFLWNFILDAIKANKPLTQPLLCHSNHPISQHLVSTMLEFMEKDGLIKKEGYAYCIVLDKVLSREVILDFCRQRADQITVANILQHFRFNPTCEVYGSTIQSQAFDHVKKIVDNLCAEDILKKSNLDTSFAWSDI